MPLDWRLVVPFGVFVWSSTRRRSEQAGLGPLGLSDAVDLAVTTGCVVDVLRLGWLAGLPGGLLGPSSGWQEAVIVLTLSTYTFDAGCWLRAYADYVRQGRVGLWSPPSWDTAVHHLAGGVGLLTLLHWGTGGPLILRLLLDNTTGVVLVVERAYCWHVGPWLRGSRPGLGLAPLPALLSDTTYWAVFLAARVVCYPLMLAYAIVELLRTIVDWQSRDGLLCCMLVCWTVFATLAHTIEFAHGCQSLWQERWRIYWDRARIAWRVRRS